MRGGEVGDSSEENGGRGGRLVVLLPMRTVILLVPPPPPNTGHEAAFRQHITINFGEESSCRHVDVWWDV